MIHVLLNAVVDFFKIQINCILFLLNIIYHIYCLANVMISKIRRIIKDINAVILHICILAGTATHIHNDIKIKYTKSHFLFSLFFCFFF